MSVGTSVLQRLTDAGYEAYFVGGMVRDTLLNREIYDIDITTSATPEQVMQLFEKTIPTGILHGTVTVMINKVAVEVTTFRVESTYQDFRRPDEVSFTTSLKEDLKRRDFTVNAIAMDQYQNLIDPFDGQQDLKDKQLKAVGNPEIRFLEDPLRMLRGIRFVSKLGFSVESETLKQLSQHANYISHISKERIKKELEGIFKGEDKDRAINLLIETDLLTPIGLGTFNQFKNKDFKCLGESIELFMLVGSLVEDFKGYLNSWPFSKNERVLIEAYRCYVKEPVSLPLVRYYEKDVFMSHLQSLTLFLSQEVMDLPELVIKSRQELAVNAQDLMSFTQKEAGPWVGQYLSLIEKRVVLKELANNKEEIELFIKELN